ncbi:MAG: hypothetical protein IRZ21_05230 [Thermoleophilaceae bacterium]|nr:hypothetical protein [Thermoleophilaceae bacterium]
MILLWWPTLFPSDTPVSWLTRGVVWTLMFEVLVLATMPFELALWGTSKGERITRRLHVARERLEPEDSQRRLGVRGGLAAGALALPLLLLGTGAHAHLWELSARPKPVTHVTKVVRVVRPVEVRRVVTREVVTAPAPVAASGAAVPSSLGSGAAAPAARSAPEPHRPPIREAPRATTNQPSAEHRAMTAPESRSPGGDTGAAPGGSTGS